MTIQFAEAAASARVSATSRLEDLCATAPFDKPTLVLDVDRVEAQYTALYCKRTGRANVGNVDFYLAYNMFRLAAILQGIAKRAIDGTASNAQAVETGKRARPTGEAGWALAERIIARGTK